jgi:hypothetical protein
MEDSSIVCTVVVVAGTVLGGLDIYLKGDGTVLSAMIGLYGAVLGFLFGKSTTKTP